MDRTLPVALALGFLASTALFADQPHLYGIKKISVAISTDPDGDFDRSKLRAEVEEKLRSAGIRVDRASRSKLAVVIGVSSIRSDQGASLGYAYSIHLALTQPVYLAHNPNRLTEAVTWQAMTLGISSAAELASRCERIVSRQMDEFVSVYLSGTE